MRSSYFTVYNMRLAGYLMMNGFPIIRIVQDSRSSKDDYLFANTNELQEYIGKWQMERNKK